MTDGTHEDEQSRVSADCPNERIVMRLRGQLQNCVNHLERAKRHSYGKERDAYDDAIAAANRTLYETLGA